MTSSPKANQANENRKLKRLDRIFNPSGVFAYPQVSRFKDGEIPGAAANNNCGAHTLVRGGLLCGVELLRDIRLDNQQHYRPSILVGASLCENHKLVVPWNDDPRFSIQVHGSLVLRWSLPQDAASLEKGKWRKASPYSHKRLCDERAIGWLAVRIGVANRAEWKINPEMIEVPATDTCECCGRSSEAIQVAPIGYAGEGISGPSYRANYDSLEKQAEKALDDALRPKIFQAVPKVITQDFLDWHLMRRQRFVEDRASEGLLHAMDEEQRLKRKVKFETEQAQMAVVGTLVHGQRQAERRAAQAKAANEAKPAEKVVEV